MDAIAPAKTEYRGWDIKVKVSCISEQVDIEIVAALQDLVVDVGILEPLRCEAELIQGRVQVDKSKVGLSQTWVLLAAESPWGRV